MQIPSAPVPPSVELAETDPFRYSAEKAKYDVAANEYQQKIAEIQQALEGNSQAEMQARNAYLQREMETLRQAIPDFADPQKAESLRNNMLTVSRDVYGFDPQEIAAVTDSRVLRVLHDAIQLEQHRAARKGDQAGQNQSALLNRGTRRLRQTGSPKDKLDRN